MTPALLFPAGLAALAAVIIPLAIHIARRSEQSPTDFAALRWLRAKPKPRSRLRFDEWPLLIARLLLIALAALWLARPVLTGDAGADVYVAAAPGADTSELGEDVEAHWLAPGFPRIEAGEAAPTGSAPIGSLVRQLDADLPAATRLSVLVPPVLDGADGERPRLSRTVDWRVTGPPTTRSTTRQGVAAPEPPALSVRHDAAHAGVVRFLRAVASAWTTPGQSLEIDVAGVDDALPSKDRVLVWLAGGTLPEPVLAWIREGGTTLISADAVAPEGMRTALWRDETGRALVEAILPTPLAKGQGRLLRLTRPLTPAETPQLLQTDFPTRLRAVLEPEPPAPTRVAAVDYAPLAGAEASLQGPRDLRPWLGVLIALTLLGERFLATRRRRAVSP